MKNIGASTLNLSLAQFSNGIRYTFPTGSRLQAGQFVVLASNAEQFQGRYSFAPFGEYEGYLNNAGERLTLVNAVGDTLFNLRYNDQDPWPAQADGQGRSLVARHVNPQGDPADPAYWGVSYFVHGSPGRDDKTATFVSQSPDLPGGFRLHHNYPNPFNLRTRLRFDVPREAHVSVKVYNARGQYVSTLAERQYSAGFHTLTWNAEDAAAGVYFVRLQAKDVNQTIKLLLLK